MKSTIANITNEADHLGSSSWITSASGDADQHLQYLPFGEDYIYQRSSSWNIPYTFSGKEKDAETGYSYFGARYYDSDISVWLSVDPLSDKYPSMSAYMYTAGNPVMLVDPDGMRFKDAFGHRVRIKAKKDGTLEYKFNKKTPEIGREYFKETHGETLGSLAKTKDGRKRLKMMNRIRTVINIIPVNDESSNNSSIYPSKEKVFDFRFSSPTYKEVLIVPHLKTIKKTAKEQISDFMEILGATMMVEGGHLHPDQIKIDESPTFNFGEKYESLFNDYVKFRIDYRKLHNQEITNDVFSNRTGHHINLNFKNQEEFNKLSHE